MYGTRVFRLTAVKGPGGGRSVPLNLADPLADGQSARARVEASARALSELGALARTPNLRHPQLYDSTLEGLRSDVQTTFLDPGSASGEAGAIEPWSFYEAGPNHLFFKVEYGVIGRFENARRRRATRNISEDAATEVFRALMLFPDDGTEGRLVVETSGRSCPVMSITSLTNWADWSRDHQKWMRLRIDQIGDLSALRRMANKAEKVEVELTRKRVGVAGGNISKDARLTITVNDRQAAVGSILGMLRPGGRPDPRTYVSQLESIAGLDTEALEQADLDFNEAAFIVTDADGIQKRFDPADIKARFTYVGSQVRPTDEAWLDRARAIMRDGLLADTDIDF